MKTTSRLSISPATPRTIGRLLLAGAICWSGAPLFAQNQPPTVVPQSQPGSQALLTQDDLREMVGPIALYPDALIALILPASTVPSDVVLGARFVDGKGDPGQAGNQPWDESVRSLVYYPDVLSWMNENLEWTASLGEAFMDQPADVMNAIQSLRATARASGALTDTPQQRVVVQQETIRIIPSDPEVIYVPQYDPEVIFVDNYSPGYTPFITFGIGFAVGSWLNYDCDWGRRYVYRGDWNRGGWDRNRWDRGGDVFINNTNNNVNVNVVNINSNNATRWNPSNRSVRQLEQRQRNGGGNARFTTAEARAAREMIRTERRQNNGRLSSNALAAARREALPTPRKLELREAAYNRAVRPQDRTNRNETAETLAEARRNRDNATPNRPIAENRRKTPTEAPRVNGQLEAARQARREENRREASETRQNVRQQAENRQAERPNQMPTRAPRADAADSPSQRPSVNERQRENRQSVQDFRQERQESRPQRQEARQERPQQRQEVRQPQPQRQEARPQPQRQEVRQQQRQEQRQVNRPEQRERNERPQQQRQERQQQRQERPQQRQEARPQQRQENRPQRQEARQERQEKKSEKRSDDGGGDRKKKND